tara:strand:+ start:1550 stop:1807 length:258 start_codon:yes stop_codon:yes gene_type:complete
MAVVISVSVPEKLHKRWKDSEIDISPSALFQTALETELDQTNRHLAYWSNRALSAEKRCEAANRILSAPDKQIKNFLLFESDREG